MYENHFLDCKIFFLGFVIASFFNPFLYTYTNLSSTFLTEFSNSCPDGQISQGLFQVHCPFGDTPPAALRLLVHPGLASVQVSRPATEPVRSFLRLLD